MKKSLHYVLIVSICCLVTISCKKKSENTEVDISNLSYTTESTSTSKTNLENAGKDLLTQLNGVSSSSAITTVTSFSSTLGSLSLKSSSVLSSITALSDLAADNSKLLNLFGSLKSTATQTQVSLQTSLKALEGTNTWSASKKEYVQSPATGKIEYLFPSVANGTTNDASLVITYQFQNTSVVTDYSDVPTVFDVVMTVKSQTVMSYHFDATYDVTNKLPASLNTYITLSTFKFAVGYNYSTANANMKYSFTNDSKIIMELYANTNGDFSSTNLNKDNSETPENVVTNANAYFQLFNIKLTGKVDFKTLAADVKVIDDNTKLTAYAADTLSANALNKSAVLVLIYADSNTKIASSEAYAIKATAGTSGGVDMRFVFADKSKVNWKDYFSTNFTSLISEFESFGSGLTK